MQILVTLFTLLAIGRCSTTPTVCDEESCICDAFSRVICNCTQIYDEVTIRPEGSYKMEPSATAIIVHGCSRLFIMSDSISHLYQLRHIELHNVKHIYFSEKSMNWSPFSRETELLNPGLKILVKNSTINDIASHTFKGRIDEIIFQDSRVEVMRPYSFTSLNGLKSIEITNTIFENIEFQAFKKFTVDRFIIKGGRIANIPSRMISDMEANEIFRIDGTNIGEISSMSFMVNGPRKVTIENNIIKTIEGDAFHLTSRGPITFRNNTVNELKRGAFMGIGVNTRLLSTYGVQELFIDNNTFNSAEIESFIFNRTSLVLRIDGINLYRTCECADATDWLGLVSAYGGGTVSCYSNIEDHFISVATYINNRCGSFKQNFWIYIVISVIIAVLIALIVIYIVVRNEAQKRKKLNIVMPDGKTYRETELHIIVERADLLTTEL